MRGSAAALAIVLVLAGCGDGDGDSTETTAATSTTDTSTSTSTTEAVTAAEVPSDFDEDQKAMVAVTQQYLLGIANKDWEAACDSRTEQEQEKLGKAVGASCETAMQTIYDTDQFQNFGELFAGKTPVSVTINGDEARLDYGTKDDFYAVREDGEWKLYDH